MVLPCEDKSSEQIFYADWVYRISTALQHGTAQMIHNIAHGNTTKSRRTGDIDIEPGEEGKGVGVASHQGKQEADSDTHSTEVECSETSDYDSEADVKEKDRDGKPFSLSTPKVPSQVFMEEAKRRAIKKKAKAGSNNNSSLDSNNSSSNSAVK